MTTPSHSSLPVAITMGDPSGVGFEVIVKALAQFDEKTSKQIVIVGDRAILDRASVDHGTEFDIARTGKANKGNLLEAVEYALKLAKSKTKEA